VPIHQVLDHQPRGLSPAWMILSAHAGFAFVDAPVVRPVQVSVVGVVDMVAVRYRYVTASWSVHVVVAGMLLVFCHAESPLACCSRGCPANMAPWPAALFVGVGGFGDALQAGGGELWRVDAVDGGPGP
jgi:hypothetical protein